MFFNELKLAIFVSTAQVGRYNSILKKEEVVPRSCFSFDLGVPEKPSDTFLKINYFNFKLFELNLLLLFYDFNYLQYFL